MGKYEYRTQTEERDCLPEDIVSSEPPNSKTRTNSVCIIHYKEEDGEAHLVHPEKNSSWEALLKAAQIRNHEALLDIAKSTPDGKIPNIFYHRKCRCRFTMKRELQSLQSATIEESTHAYEENRKSARQAPSTSRVYDKQCIFCNNMKYKKGQKSREPLVKCVDLRADKTVGDVAMERQDKAILSIAARDIVAAEAHYHRSCYRYYTKKTDCTLCSVPEVDEGDIQYQEAEADAYSYLFSYIRSTLLSDPKIVKMKDLTIILVNHMQRVGITKIKESTKKHIRRNLETEFCESVHIFPDNKGKLLVMPDNLSKYELAKENVNLQDQINSMYQSHPSDDKKIVSSAAQRLRSVIKQQDDVKEWPHLPESLDKAAIKLPVLLKQFLTGLLTGDISSKQPSQRVTWLVESFGQDLVYGVSCGKQKPPKHILLQAVVKNLTGNAELIQALNRLGHGVSYSQIEKNETVLCLQKLAAAEDGSVVLPRIVQPYLFTTMAWDNIDFLEETLPGVNSAESIWTTEREISAASRGKEETEKYHSRGLCSTTIHYWTKTWTWATDNYCKKNRDDTVQQAFMKDVLWLLTRQVDSTQSAICSWTGFNILVRQGLQIYPDNIGYLSTINAPATSMSTCFEILKQAQNIMANLHLKKVVIVFDQAMFAKVSEVIWKHRERYPGIIVQRGTFHTICKMLSILGKRFQYAGLRDLCIESGIVAEGSLGAVMERRRYNRAVRVHKYVLEAMMRISWKGFESWMHEHQAEGIDQLEETKELIGEIRENTCQKQFDNTLQNPSFTATVITIP